ncbi:MAG: hypothetical protein IKH91_01390, partial [Prevotella sp.]|nr:hypothetical protein [Prevotella sp.]
SYYFRSEIALSFPRLMKTPMGKGKHENVKKRTFSLKIYTFFCLLNKNVIYLQSIIRYDKTISEDDQSRSNT